jgi:hypothetical protein
LGELECAFCVVCWKDLDEEDLIWNLLGKIWIQNVGDIDLKAISAAENSK